MMGGWSNPSWNEKTEGGSPGLGECCENRKGDTYPEEQDHRADVRLWNSERDLNSTLKVRYSRKRYGRGKGKSGRREGGTSSLDREKR